MLRPCPRDRHEDVVEQASSGGHTHNIDFSFPEGREYLCNLSSGLRRRFGWLRARRSGPDADGAVSPDPGKPSIARLFLLRL
jgi:hypothetical protein